MIPRQPEMKREHLPLSGTTIDEGSGTTEGAKSSPSPADVDAAGSPYSGNVINKRNLLVEMLPVSGTAGLLSITALGQQKGHLLILMLLVICVVRLLLMMAPRGSEGTVLSSVDAAGNL